MPALTHFKTKSQHRMRALLAVQSVIVQTVSRAGLKRYQRSRLTESYAAAPMQSLITVSVRKAHNRLAVT